MDKILGFLTAFLVLFFAPTTGKTQIPFNGCIDFENLAPGPRTGNDSVRVGDYLLSTPSYLVTFDSAKDVGGDLVFNNFQVIENGLFELGNGRYIFINGALRFDFGSRKVCRVELKYFGSSFSIGVNDKAIHSFSISDFIRIPTNLFPGVHIIVHPDPLKPYQGTLVLEGEIYNFHFGGTEIQLDDVCFTFCQTDPCVISDIQLDVNLCDVNGNFYVDLDLEYAGTGDSFQILLGGNTLTYAYNDLPLSLGPFDSSFPGSSNGDVIQLGGVVWDNNNRVCSRQFGVFDTIYCDYACVFDSIEADITECHPDGSYDVSINFNYQNSIHDTFGVYVGGQFYGLHLYADLPLQISNIAQPGGTKIPV
ncbi:MAG TPA: hypothetical protein PKC40_08720, partial [Saprospiraceae bacterium]|nr:hypothetical protein [Saprospiraceae bacterium]